MCRNRGVTQRLALSAKRKRRTRGGRASKRAHVQSDPIGVNEASDRDDRFLSSYVSAFRRPASPVRVAKEKRLSVAARPARVGSPPYSGKKGGASPAAFVVNRSSSENRIFQKADSSGLVRPANGCRLSGASTALLTGSRRLRSGHSRCSGADVLRPVSTRIAWRRFGVENVINLAAPYMASTSSVAAGRSTIGHLTQAGAGIAGRKVINCPHRGEIYST